ncbi:MAG: nucleotidyltransferase family protein [bacterium]|nr:nucleotidyltransferase family protein [bacterium]
MQDVEKIFVYPDFSIEKAIVAIQRGSIGIALVVNKEERFISTLTDGDIRRALLNKFSLDVAVKTLLLNQSIHPMSSVTAPLGTPTGQLLQIMKNNSIRHVPLLDKEGRVVELALLSEMIGEVPPMPPLTAIIMAGGIGKRLRPLTENLPKPMLPLNNRPLLEKIIGQLYKSGIKKIYITTCYKPEVIKNYFGNGSGFGVEINYINEEQPLGTAGALSLIGTPNNPTLVINGDILTQLDFRAMYNFHQSQNAVMTVGVRLFEFNIPYGVVKTDDITITDLVEKPSHQVIVNAGIYLLEPAVYKYVPNKTHFNMTDLISYLIKEKQHVISFPIPEYWLDIGRPADYQQANEDSINGKI